MSEVRVILAGLGARSRIWREVLDADPRARLVGLVDTDSARLAAAAAERPRVATGASLAEVAAAVEEGSADVGLGTPALARRFGLDFLPLRDDPFDLVIPLEVAESEAGRLLIELVRYDAFRAAAAFLEKGGLERPADGHGE